MIIEFIKTQPALFVILCIAINLLGSFGLYAGLKKLNKNRAEPLDQEVFHTIYLVGSIVTMIIFGFIVIENL
jgi:hypothetical protein